jgi:hypothetical protein
VSTVASLLDLHLLLFWTTFAVTSHVEEFFKLCVSLCVSVSLFVLVCTTSCAHCSLQFQSRHEI